MALVSDNYDVKISSFNHVTVQSTGEDYFFTSNPKLKHSAQSCNKFDEFIRLPSTLLLTQFLVRCICQLNSPPQSSSQLSLEVMFSALLFSINNEDAPPLRNP